MDEVLTLNVGGQRFETLRTTLCKYPKTMLGVMFSNESFSNIRQKDGSYFFDRDPKHFMTILNFYRTGELPESITVEFMKELDWWNIPYKNDDWRNRSIDNNPLDPSSIWQPETALKFAEFVFKHNSDLTDLRLIIRFTPEHITHINRYNDYNGNEYHFSIPYGIGSIIKIITPFNIGYYKSNDLILKRFTYGEDHLYHHFRLQHHRFKIILIDVEDKHVDILCKIKNPMGFPLNTIFVKSDKTHVDNNIMYLNGMAVSCDDEYKSIMKKINDRWKLYFFCLFTLVCFFFDTPCFLPFLLLFLRTILDFFVFFPFFVI